MFFIHFHDHVTQDVNNDQINRFSASEGYFSFFLPAILQRLSPKKHISYICDLIKTRLSYQFYQLSRSTLP